MRRWKSKKKNYEGNDEKQSRVERIAKKKKEKMKD